MKVIFVSWGVGLGTASYKRTLKVLQFTNCVTVLTILLPASIARAAFHALLDCGSAPCKWLQTSVAPALDRHMLSVRMRMLQVTVGADRLEQRLEVQNIDDGAPLSFTTALHTYFTVSSIHDVLAQPRLPRCLVSILGFK